MIFLLDTSIILIYLRESFAVQIIDKTFSPLNFPNTPIIFVVTIGEIKSLALRNKWGKFG